MFVIYLIVQGVALIICIINIKMNVRLQTFYGSVIIATVTLSRSSRTIGASCENLPYHLESVRRNV